MSEIMIEITITSKKDGSEKIEKFPMDEGLYKSTESLNEEERKKFLTKEYRAYKKEQKIQRKQVSIDEVDEAYDLVHDVPDSSLDPHQAALAKERVLLLHKELRKLPQDQARVIKAIYFGGKKQGQVATEMGISQPAVAYLKRKALAKLKVRLSGKV